MRGFLIAASAAIALIGSHSANAGSATATAAVNKIAAPLKVVTTGLAADCTWSPGMAVMTMSTTGGDGKAITYTFGGTPTGDFAISGANVVIGPNGIAPANCGVVENLAIIATQP
jgi:hypothetical protein